MRATLGTGSLEEPKGPDTSVQPYKQIILFGDSNTQNAGTHDSAYFSAAFQAGMSSDSRGILLSLRLSS